MNGLIDLMFAYVRTNGIAIVATMILFLLTLLLNAFRVRKRITFLMMWIIVFRLLVPVGLPSEYSLLNIPFIRDLSQRYDFPDSGGIVGDYEIAISGSDEYNDALYAGLEPELDHHFAFRYIYYTQNSDGDILAATTFREKYGSLAVCVWLGGVFLFWGYGLVSAILVKKRVATATIVEPGVYETDRITTPFILGIFRPIIYLPLGLEEREREMILAHERMHLRWGDQIFKLITYFAVGIHWFSIWIVFYFYRIFLCMMEEACDQDVLHELGEACKADYGEILLRFAERRQFGRAMTVAFNESWIEERIKLVLKFKHPLRWMTLPAVILVMVAAVTLGTNSVIYDGSVVEGRFYTDEEIAETGLPGGVAGFRYTKEDRIRSLGFDLEIWNSEGLVQQQRIMEYMPQNGNTLPGVMEFDWAFDMCSDRQDATYMNCSLRVGDHLVQQRLDLGAYYPGMVTNILCSSSGPYTFRDEESAVLFCGMYHNAESAPTQLDATDLSQPDTMQIKPGNIAVILRMHQFSGVVPMDMTMEDILPEDFLPRETLRICAEGKLADVPKDITAKLRKELMGFSYDLKRIHRVSDADCLSAWNSPSVTLFSEDGNSLALQIQSSGIIVTEQHTGQSWEYRADDMSCMMIVSEIYHLLGIPKSCQEVFSLPKNTGERVFGWSLTNAIESKDIWLYNHEYLTDSLLLVNGRGFKISLPYGGDYQCMELVRMNDNGMPDLVICAVQDGEQQLYWLAAESEEGWYINVLDISGLKYYLEPIYGTHADHPDLSALHIPTADQEYWFNTPAFLEAYPEWKPAMRDTYRYRDVRFQYKNGSISVRFLCDMMIEKQKEDDGRETLAFPIAELSSEIQLVGPNVNEAFRFYNVAVYPPDAVEAP